MALTITDFQAAVGGNHRLALKRIKTVTEDAPLRHHGQWESPPRFEED